MPRQYLPMHSLYRSCCDCRKTCYKTFPVGVPLDFAPPKIKLSQLSLKQHLFLQMFPSIQPYIANISTTNYIRILLCMYLFMSHLHSDCWITSGRLTLDHLQHITFHRLGVHARHHLLHTMRYVCVHKVHSSNVICILQISIPLFRQSQYILIAWLVNCFIFSAFITTLSIL